MLIFSQSGIESIVELANFSTESTDYTTDFWLVGRPPYQLCLTTCLTTHYCSLLTANQPKKGSMGLQPLSYG